MQASCTGPQEVKTPEPAEARWVFPVVHDQQSRTPEPLTEEEKKEILDQVMPLCGPGECIWFIRFHWSAGAEWFASGKPQYDLTVYLRPEVSTPRLRKGRRIGLWYELWKPYTKGKEELPERAVGTYYQVSLPDKPFGRSLDVPPATLMPYPLDTKLPDKEVVEIIDFIRTNPKDERGYAAHGSAAIRGMEKTRESLVPEATIWAGTSSSAANGDWAADWWYFKKTPKGLKFLGVSHLWD
jgi:hypothetical protein